jgi:hypothetical protein
MLLDLVWLQAVRLIDVFGYQTYPHNAAKSIINRYIGITVFIRTIGCYLGHYLCWICYCLFLYP